MSVPVSLLAPAHTDTAACGRKSTKFSGIGSQLVEYHGNCLTRIGAEDDVRSLDLRIATRGVGRELAVDELGKGYPVPAAVAQQFMRDRHRFNSAVEGGDKISH